MIRSSSMTSRTANAAAIATGLPPNVLKNSPSGEKRSASSRRVMTAATGCPLPIGLPTVTMSGCDPQTLVAPHRGTRTAVSRLDLVGDPEPAGMACVRMTSSCGERRIQVDDPIARQNRVHDRRGEPMTGLFELSKGPVEISKALVDAKSAQRVGRPPRSDVLRFAARAPQSSGVRALIASVMPWYA